MLTNTNTKSEDSPEQRSDGGGEVTNLEDSVFQVQDVDIVVPSTDHQAVVLRHRKTTATQNLIWCINSAEKSVVRKVLGA